MGNRLACCSGRNIRAEKHNELIIEESRILHLKVSNLETPQKSSATGKQNARTKNSIIRQIESGEDLSKFQATMETLQACRDQIDKVIEDT